MPAVAQVAAVAIASAAPKNIATSNFDRARMWKSSRFPPSTAEPVNGSLKIAYSSRFSLRFFREPHITP
jgi:hypothetical protein